MATILTCPSCGKRSKVASQAPGSAVRCPHCTAVMKVPGEAPPVAATATASVARAPAIVPPIVASPAAPPLLEQLPPAPQVQAPGFICSVCEGSFPIDQVYDQNGSIICEACHAAGASLPADSEEADPGSFPVVPSLSTLVIEPATDEAPPPWQQAPAAGVVGVAAESQETVAPQEPDAVDSDLADLSATPRSGPRVRRPPFWKRMSPTQLVVAGSCAFLLTCVLTYVITRYGGARPRADISPSAPVVSNPSTPPDTSVGGPDQSMSEWEKRNAPRLSQWRSTAKSMEVSGDLAGAQLLYQKMLLLSKAPGATLQNAGVVAMLGDAQTSFDAITRKIGPPPAPLAVAPPPLTPAPVQTSSVTPGDSSTQPVALPPESPATTPAATAPPAPPAPAAPAQIADDGVNWEPAHHDQLLQLSADAGLLEKQQHPVAALAKLQELLQLVSNHRTALTDPQLKSTVAAAEESRKRLLVFARDSDEARAITARSLLAAGLKAENQKKWKTALDSLSDASHLIGSMLKPVQRYRDPLYLTSLNATAVAYMNLKLNQRTGELFSDDEPLGRASLAMNSPSRDLVWNRAVNDLTQKFNIMRSVKMLHEYMDQHTEPDEPLMNLLGTVLFVADESNPVNRKVLDDGIGFYGQRTMDLEKTRPGERRWGIQWLPEADAQAKFDQYNKSLDAYAEAVRVKTAADTHLKDLQNSQHASVGRATAAQITAAKASVAAAIAGVKRAHDAIPRPPWLTDVEPIVPKIDTGALLAVGPTSAPAPASPGPSGPVAVPASPLAAVAPASQPAVDVAVPPAPEARYAAAFPVDKTHLVTAAEPLGSATTAKIEDTSGGVMTAKVVARSDRLALLEISSADASAPLKFLTLATDFTGGPVQCAAIPQANVFGPTMALLSADAPVPSRSAWWVNLSDHPRLPGSPLLNAQNEVIGVEVAARDDARQKIPAVTLDDLRKFLEANHVVSVASGAKGDPNVVAQVTAESE